MYLSFLTNSTTFPVVFMFCFSCEKILCSTIPFSKISKAQNYEEIILPSYSFIKACIGKHSAYFLPNVLECNKIAFHLK